jgi:hypothetical protein
MDRKNWSISSPTSCCPSPLTFEASHVWSGTHIWIWSFLPVPSANQVPSPPNYPELDHSFTYFIRQCFPLDMYLPKIHMLEAWSPSVAKLRSDKTLGNGAQWKVTKARPSEGIKVVLWDPSFSLPSCLATWVLPLLHSPTIMMPSILRSIPESSWDLTMPLNWQNCETTKPLFLKTYPASCI